MATHEATIHAFPAQGRFALYSRVSTNHSQDPELQLRELREYASARSWTVVQEYTDLGVSGSKDSRPALNRLMADAQRRKFDGILVWKLDRFGRSLRHLVNAIAELEALGVAFVCLRDNLDLSTHFQQEYHPHMQTDQIFPDGNPGEPVPTVDMADLKSVWTIYRDIESAHPEGKGAVDSGLIERACSAGADTGAVMYRLWMLGFLEVLPDNLLDRWKENGQLDDAVFRVIARLPMKWVEMGVPQSELPFDVQSFLNELQQELR